MLTKFAQIGGSNLSTFTRTGPTPLKRGSTSTHTNGNQNIKVDAKHIKKHAKHIKKHLGLFFYDLQFVRHQLRGFYGVYRPLDSSISSYKPGIKI